MGLNRYYVPSLPHAGSVALPPEEAQHAIRVRRESIDGKCVAFDGLGNSAACRIVQATHRDVLLEIESYQFAPHEPNVWIRLAVAMPKGDRQRAVIEKAVELGVHELVPLTCERSVSLPSVSAIPKWYRTVVETCKQCERNRLMTISASCTFEWMIQAVKEMDSAMVGTSIRILAHPTRGTLAKIDKSMSLYDRVDVGYDQVTIAIGPEGGFTRREVKSASDAGWHQLDLGPRILRVETAVCAASIYASLCVERK